MCSPLQIIGCTHQDVVLSEVVFVSVSVFSALRFLEVEEVLSRGRGRRQSFLDFFSRKKAKKYLKSCFSFDKRAQHLKLPFVFSCPPAGEEETEVSASSKGARGTNLT